jgi:hypothetical protein
VVFKTRLSFVALALVLTGQISAADGQAGPVFTDIPHLLPPDNYSVPGAGMAISMGTPIE